MELLVILLLVAFSVFIWILPLYGIAVGIRVYTTIKNKKEL